MSNFLNETNNLLNKIDNSIKNLENKQPYIEHEKVKIYFKIPSPKVDIIQLSNTQFNLKYHHYNIKEPNYSEYDILDSDCYEEASEKAHDLMDSIMDYINLVEKTQVIKTIDLDFDITINRNFVDEYLLNSLADTYIANILNNKYKSYVVSSKSIENNDISKLFVLELTIDGIKIIEYFLIINVFCINLSINKYCNLEMKNMLAKMLLTASFSRRLKEDIYLNFSSSELALAFEIEDTKEKVKNNQINFPYNYDSIKETNFNTELSKFNNLIKNYSIFNNDENFITSYAFNILLLGNDCKEKDDILDYIKETFNNNKIFGDELSVYELDIKKDVNSIKDLNNIFDKKIKKNDVLYIKNFDYAMDEEIESLLLKKLLNFIEENMIKALIISGNEEGTNKILNKSKELYSKMSLVFHFNDYNVDKLYELLISKINQEKFKINFDEAKVKELIDKLSKTSIDKNDFFVNKLYTYMFKYVLENDLDEFNIDCFPNLNNKNSLEHSLNKLNELIGLTNVKREINKLVSYWKYSDKIKDYCLDNKMYLNMFFTGNSGTGKTTVARIISSILFNLNFIKEDKFIEITPNDLVADYLGQTKTKTKEILKNAKGGILFIDEAYLFLNNSSYLKEALIELLKYLENPKNVVIFAGYSESMEKVLGLNAGLKSRISYYINFEDYSLEELIHILKYKIEKKGLKIEEDAVNKLIPLIKEKMKIKNYGNARYIEKLINIILIKHSENMESIYEEKDLLVIKKEDIDEEKIINDKIKSNSNFGFITMDGDVSI